MTGDFSFELVFKCVCCTKFSQYNVQNNLVFCISKRLSPVCVCVWMCVWVYVRVFGSINAWITPWLGRSQRVICSLLIELWGFLSAYCISITWLDDTRLFWKLYTLVHKQTSDGSENGHLLDLLPLLTKPLCGEVENISLRISGDGEIINMVQMN